MHGVGWVAGPIQISQSTCFPTKARPSETIPDELIDSIIKTKHVNDALFNLRQLHFGIFDMTVHTPKDHDEIVNMKISETYNQLNAFFATVPGNSLI